MPTPNSAQKKDIARIVKKYLSFNERADSTCMGGAIIGAVLGISCDLVLTGGMTMLSTFFMSGVVGGLAGYKSELIKEKERFLAPNSAGQFFTAENEVRQTLFKMEHVLRVAFESVAKNEMPRERFLQKAREIETDIKVLSPAFTIVSGGHRCYGTDRFEFVLECKKMELPQPEITTLSEYLLPRSISCLVPQIPALLKISAKPVH